MQEKSESTMVLEAVERKIRDASLEEAALAISNLLERNDGDFRDGVQAAIRVVKALKSAAREMAGE